MEDPIDASAKAINQQPVNDKIILAELILPQGDKLRMEKIVEELSALMEKNWDLSGYSHI